MSASSNAVAAIARSSTTFPHARHLLEALERELDLDLEVLLREHAHQLRRRERLTMLQAASVATVTDGWNRNSASSIKDSKESKTLRLLHLTDLHMSFEPLSADERKYNARMHNAFRA